MEETKVAPLVGEWQSVDDATPFRRTHKKSRKGCLTCKSRRVKCDEAKPRCQRCERGAHKCEYGKPVAVRASGRTLIALKPKTIGRIASSRRSSSTPDNVEKDLQGRILRHLNDIQFDNPLDDQYFRLFWKSTSKNLSGYFDDDIWNRVILQACHQEEFARHAVVAIAALHRTTTMPTSAISSEVESRDRHHTFALLRYAKALRMMRQVTENLDEATVTEYQLRRALIASLLITCFEAFHGNSAAAITQVISAIKLLYSIRQRVSPVSRYVSAYTPHTSLSSAPLPSTNIGNSIIDRDLLSAFSRLEIDTILITRREVIPQVGGIKGLEDEVLISNMPRTFETLKQARFYRDVVVRQSTSQRAMYGYMPYEESEGDEGTDSNFASKFEDLDVTGTDNLPNLSKIIGTPVPVELYPLLAKQLRAYKNNMTNFATAFLPVYERARQEPRTSKEFQGATIIMIALQAANLERRSIEDEELANSYIDKAGEAMLGLVKDVLGLEHEGSDKAPQIRSSRSPSLDDKFEVREEDDAPNKFIFDSSVVYHLFLIATRSTDREIRKAAIDILKSCRRREGFWDSEFAVSVAEWFRELDEAEDVGVPAGELEGGERKKDRMAKLIITDEEFNLRERSAWVKCKRIAGERQGFLPMMTLKW